MTNTSADFDFTKLKVLVIDDDPYIRVVLKKYLTTLGVPQVFTAENGLDGFAFLNRDNPDIILCDIKMPELDGFQFLRHIRSSGSSSNKLPVIFLTADTRPDYIQRAKELGVDAFLVKPVSIQALKTTIAHALSH